MFDATYDSIYSILVLEVPLEQSTGPDKALYDIKFCHTRVNAKIVKFSILVGTLRPSKAILGKRLGAS